MSAPTPTDFPAPDAYYTQEPAGLFMGVEPAMALCALLVLIAVAVLAYYVGARRFSRRGGSNATTDAIHAKILKASQAALAADSNHLKQRSEDLVNLIDKLLGPVIKLGAGIGGPLKMLEQALKGEIDVPASAPGDHGHGPGQGSGHDAHRSDPAAAAAAAGGGGGGAAASHVTVINLPLHALGQQVHSDPPSPGHGPADGHAAAGHAPAGHAAHPPAPHSPPSPPAATTKRKMTTDEQIDALARAVRKFNDHWSKSEARKKELSDARDALGG